MFSFLKEKLKKGIAKFSKDIEEKGEEEEVPKESFMQRLFGKKQPKEEKEQAKKEDDLPQERKDVKFEKKEQLLPKHDVKEEKAIAPEISLPVVQEKAEGNDEYIDAPYSEKKFPFIEKKQESGPLLHTKPKEENRVQEEKTKDKKAKIAPGKTHTETEKKPPEKVHQIEKTEPLAEKTHDEDREAESREKNEQKAKGFFERLKEKIVTKRIDDQKFVEMFWDIEVALLENNIAYEVIERIKEDLKKEIVDVPLRRSHVQEEIMIALKRSFSGILENGWFDLMERISEKSPYVICFVGINGSGKTTTIAKIARMLIDQKKKVVLAAADTFRAAAIDQLQIHADNLGIKMIRHSYGADPAAVAFDAVKYAEAKKMDVVLIDTAGRLHSNTNLVDEMKKIVRVAKPDLKLFIGEAITGNDCVEQAVKFNEAIGIDGIILSKADIDEKGGASLSVSYVTKKPVLYLGTGQDYHAIRPFNKEEIISSLGLEE